jgi:exodeoxyribonuclease VII small subunit
LPKFEECLQRLEVVVREMERGELSLEDSLKLFEEGVVLSNSCQKELEEADSRVVFLLKQNGNMRAEAFSEDSDLLT